MCTQKKDAASLQTSVMPYQFKPRGHATQSLVSGVAGAGGGGVYPGSERYWWTMCPLWLPPLSARSYKLGRSLAEEMMGGQRSEGNGGRWQDRGMLKKFLYQLEVVTVLVSAVMKRSD